MKRLLLAFTILTLGSTVFCALRSAAMHFRQEAASAREALTTQTQLLAQARGQLTTVEERVRDLHHLWETRLPGAVQPSSNSLLSLAGATHLTAEQSERLLAELGFNWGSTGDYLIVSKGILGEISLQGMRGVKLNEAACQVLAITPEERADIDAMTQKLGGDYRTWAESHVQRGEPDSNILAQYSLTADPEFSQSLSNSFTGGIFAALGNERGSLLLDYARSWMSDLGMYGNGDSAFTVTRQQGGQELRLGFELKRASGTMSTEVSPYQPFPEAFLPLFPNGWTDLAQREGFELPKAFQKK